MNRYVRGSARVDSDPASSLSVPRSPNAPLLTIGFRLVCDDAARTVRGGSFYYGQNIASGPDGDRLGPDNYCDTFGFRLVREGT